MRRRAPTYRERWVKNDDSGTLGFFHEKQRDSMTGRVFFYAKKRAEPAQLVDINKLGLNSNIKKFSYSFICGKGYSPPSGENSFLSTV